MSVASFLATRCNNLSNKRILNWRAVGRRSLPIHRLRARVEQHQQQLIGLAGFDCPGNRNGDGIAENAGAAKNGGGDSQDDSKGCGIQWFALIDIIANSGGHDCIFALHACLR